MDINVTFSSELSNPGQMKEILTMAYANSHDLMKRTTDESHPMFALYRTVFLHDISLMLGKDSGKKLGSGVITAASDEGLVGFLVFTQAVNCADACGANYICVAQEYRKQGIMTQMLDLLKVKYPHIALSCVVDKVPMYEKLGFSIKCGQGAQVAMRIGDDYEMNVVDAVYLHNHPQVEIEVNKLIKMYGEGVVKIEADFEAATSTLHQEVSRYVAIRQQA